MEIGSAVNVESRGKPVGPIEAVLHRLSDVHKSTAGLAGTTEKRVNVLLGGEPRKPEAVGTGLSVPEDTRSVVQQMHDLLDRIENELHRLGTTVERL